MAIPFFEPKHSQQASDGIADQVDGHVPSTTNNFINDQNSPNNAFTVDLGYDNVDYEAPMPYYDPSVPGASMQSTVGSEFPATHSTSDQSNAWKLLALAMCKALKQYYIQNANSSNSISSTLSVHLMPNGTMQTKWK